MKVTIIGAGAVGATTAYSLLACDVASEIVLIDVNKEKAVGESMDLIQATPLLSNANIYCGDYQDAVDSDFVVITSGIGRKPGQTRLDLAQTNVNIIKSVATEIVKYAPKAFYIIVANPVDILTYVFLKVSGVPKNKVIGTGTLLDTIRLRAKIANDLHISTRSVHANVFGEHGDTSFITWSRATMAGASLDTFCKKVGSPIADNIEAFHNDCEEYVKSSGAEIIKRKGCTVYGIATSVKHIIKTLSGSKDSLMTISSLMDGTYGLEDVCLSVLTLLGKDGVKMVIPQNLSEDELAKLAHSAKTLKEFISQIKI